MQESCPALYTFRRCPYAMRARIALHYSGTDCALREVDLKNKPSSMIKISPKGTVPVLQLDDGSVIDESLDIIYYALSKNDPEGINNLTSSEEIVVKNLISKNDIEFAGLLRKYKYFERYPEESQEEYRKKIEEQFLAPYEEMLENTGFLIGKKSVADIAIIPFIRQFALSDEDWFFNSKYKNVIKWLNELLDSESFKSVIMAKNTPWKEGDDSIRFLF